MITLAKISLAKKLTFLTIFLCAVGTFSILLTVNFSLNHLNDKYLNNELASRKKIIEKVYVEPLWNFEKIQVTQLSKSFLVNNGFAYIMAIKVTKPDGEVLFNDNSQQVKSKTFDDFLQLPYTKHGSVKVLKRGELLATVDIIFTNEGFVTKFKEILFKFFLLSLGIIVITSIWIFVFFNKYLTHPLNALLEHIKQLKDEDYSPKSYQQLPYELHLIANALNFTSLIIKKRNDDLKDHTDNLEKIVDLRTRELEIQIAENMNSQRLVAVGEMASGIAHEINNPLTIIFGQILKVKKQYKGHEIEEDLFATLDKAVLMIDRISKIIKGLKTISRNGNSDPMNEFSINPLIEEIKLLTDMKLQTLKLKLAINIDPTLDTAYGREVQISQVLVNLVNNSVDAISTLDNPNPWIKIDIVDKGEMLEFRVTDSGNGISPQLKEKIMYPFFTTKEVGKGTGLGLSVSKGIIKEHGGELTYNDKCPNTQFVFTLYKHNFKDLKQVA